MKANTIRPFRPIIITETLVVSGEYLLFTKKTGQSISLMELMTPRVVSYFRFGAGWLYNLHGLAVVRLGTSANRSALLGIHDSLGRSVTFTHLTDNAFGVIHVVKLLMELRSQATPTTNTIPQSDFDKLADIGIVFPNGVLPMNDQFIRASEKRFVANCASENRRKYGLRGCSWPWLLTGVTDARNIRYATFAYDAREKQTRPSMRDGVEKTTMVYDRINQRVTVKNALGSKKSSITTTLEMEAASNERCRHCVPQLSCEQHELYIRHKRVHQNCDRMKRVVQPASFVTVLAFPLPSRVEVGTPTAETTTVAWNTALRRPTSVTVAGQVKTTYTWTAGRLTKVQKTDLTTAANPARIWTMTYTPAASLRRLTALCQELVTRPYTPGMRPGFWPP